MDNAFKTSTHSLMAVAIGGVYVVSCFGIGADGQPDYDQEICHKECTTAKEAAELFTATKAKIAPKLSRARALEIIEQAKAAANGPRTAGGLGLGGFGWEGYLDRVMTADERLAVKLVWETLPGHYTFVGTLVKLTKRTNKN